MHLALLIAQDDSEASGNLLLSLLPFLVIGAWGVGYVMRHGDAVCLPGLELAYVVFFSGVMLTALGSGYYHLVPANEPLAWDRLPALAVYRGHMADQLVGTSNGAATAHAFGRRVPASSTTAATWRGRRTRCCCWRRAAGSRPRRAHSDRKISCGLPP